MAETNMGLRLDLGGVLGKLPRTSLCRDVLVVGTESTRFVTALTSPLQHSFLGFLPGHEKPGIAVVIQ